MPGVQSFLTGRSRLRQGGYRYDHGPTREVEIVISSSEEQMPKSVLAQLYYVPQEIPLSGYGIVMGKRANDIALRPIAFGLNFTEVINPRE
jgi:hypothetical protein